jgi:hypothetical protein
MNFRPVAAQAIVMDLVEGAELTLEREAHNPYDPNAIMVKDPATGEHLGYVAKEVAVDLAPEMDAGKFAKCWCDVPGGKATILMIETYDEEPLAVA